MRKEFFHLAVLTLSAFLCACGPSNTSSNNTLQTKAATNASGASTNAASSNTVYSVRGIVQRYDDNGGIVIKHEEIPGYMQAMTMPFDAKDTNEYAGINPGDVVRFNLVITDTEGWIEQISKLSETNIPSLDFRESFRLVREVDTLAEGDMIPNYRFTNELGQVTQLHDHLGKAVALTFLFTRCPFPEYCPRMARQFAETMNALKQQGSPTNWHLFAITIDPEWDTPQRLQNYARTYKYDSNRWNFLTGAMIDIDAITEQFDVAFAWRTGSIAHTLTTAVIDPNGRIQKIFPARRWTSKDLIEELTKAAAVPREANAN